MAEKRHFGNQKVRIFIATQLSDNHASSSTMSSGNMCQGFAAVNTTLRRSDVTAVKGDGFFEPTVFMVSRISLPSGNWQERTIQVPSVMAQLRFYIVNYFPALLMKDDAARTRSRIRMCA